MLEVCLLSTLHWDDMAGISEEICHLDSAAFIRYGQKLSLSGYNVPDPYSLGRAQWDDEVSNWPLVDYGCIYNDFVNTPGMYTAESLQSYNYTRV